MHSSPIFNEKAFPWRKKALEKLIEADDAAGLEKFLKKFPQAVEWEEVYGPNHQTYIHKAAQDQKYAAATVLLEHGARIDQLGIGGGTVIEHALRLSFANQPAMDAQDEAFVEKLLAKGANINQPDNRGFPPLKTAAWSGKTDMVKFLLAHGADPKAAEDSGNTLLMDVVRHDSWGGPPPGMEIVRLLLAVTKDVDQENKFGMTALFFAKSVAAAQELIEQGANPEHKDKKGRFAWDVEGNKDTPVAAYIQKVVAAREELRRLDALDRQIEDSLLPVPLPNSKPLTLKKAL